MAKVVGYIPKPKKKAATGGGKSGANTPGNGAVTPPTTDTNPKQE